MGCGIGGVGGCFTGNAVIQYPVKPNLQMSATCSNPESWVLRAQRTLPVCLFLLLFTLAGSIRGHAQIDSLFWFAAPNLADNHGDRPILLRMAAQDSAATVVISQPANPAFTPIVTRLAANTAASVDLTPWIDLIENKPANTVNKKGLLIRSTARISAYYDIANRLNGDMFSLKGRNALGTAFYVPFQNVWRNNNHTSSIDIVATRAGTLVTITPSRDMVGHKAGIPFDIVLNEGETFTCEAASVAGAGHLGGTFIKASKPIAITTHDDSINPGIGACRDTAGDQLIPDKKAGKDFIVVRGYLDVPDNFYVLATQNNTLVWVDGQVVDTLAAGQQYRHVLAANTAYVTTSQPVHLFHISGFGCEVGGAVIPTLTCTGSASVSITRATTQFLSVSIVAPTAITGSFTFGGRTDIITAALFQPVPGTQGAWSYLRLPLSVAQFAVGSAATIRNSAGYFHLGFIHGDRSSTTRYGYFSAFSEGGIEVEASPGPYCQGSSAVLSAGSVGTNRFTWRGPNGFTASGAQVLLTNLQPEASGWYVAETVGARCHEYFDSVYLRVQGFRVVRERKALCTGESLQLASGIRVSRGGEYRDTLRYPSGCDSLVRIWQVVEKPVPVLALTKSNDVNCEVGKVQLTVKGAATYQWQPAATLSNARSAYPEARPATATLYTVKGTALNGCSATDSIWVAVSKESRSPGHSVPTAFTPNGDGRNDCFGVAHWGWMKDFTLRIFNRWGAMVFQTNDIGRCWNGTFQGQPQASQAFVYIISGQSNCGPVYREGTVVLIR